MIISRYRYIIIIIMLFINKQKKCAYFIRFRSQKIIFHKLFYFSKKKTYQNNFKGYSFH